MSHALSPPGPTLVTWLLLWRDLRARIASPWFGFVVFAVCLITWIYGAGFQRTFATESVLVTTNPLLALDMMVAGFLGLVLGLRLASALAWEREHRTLEVLLVGPVSWPAVVLAKFLAEAGILCLVVLHYIVYLLLAQPLGPGVVSDVGAILVLPVFVLPILALGLLASAFARTVRGAVVLFIVLLGLLAVVEFAGQRLAAMAVDEMSLLLLYLRAGLETAGPVLRIVSPVGQFAALVEVLSVETGPPAAAVIPALGLTVVLLVAAVALARARGVVE